MQMVHRRREREREEEEGKEPKDQMEDRDSTTAKAVILVFFSSTYNPHTAFFFF